MPKSTSKSLPPDLPKPLKIFLYATALLSATSWLFALPGELRLLDSPHFGLYPIGNIGGDFKDYQSLFDHLHSMEFFRTTGITGPPYLYPAPLAIFYHLLFALWGHHRHSILILWAFIVLSVGVVMILFYYAIRRRGIARLQAGILCIATAILSFPLHYEFMAGNVEVLIWVMLVAAMWAYRNNMLWIAGGILGVAIACKWYPIILLGCCLRRTKYKVIPIALITCALAAILSDIWLGPTFRTAAIETRRGAQIFLDMFAKQYVSVEFDHSFFSFYKAFAHHFHPNLNVALTCYFVLAGSGTAVLYWVRIRRLPVVNQIVILFILSITLPPVSFDYTLMHLYTCWGIFALYVLDRYADGESLPFANWAMFWFAFALAPYNFAVLFGKPFGAQMRLVGLVALLYLFMKHPFFEPNDTQLTTPDSNQLAQPFTLQS